jgi:hypothetical protein
MLSDMLYINEWLPNPVGPDAAGEFVELYNSGNSASALNGYALGTGAKKRFSLAGYTIQPGGYLVLKKTQTKLALKNSDGALFLYGSSGQLVDHAAFEGSAPEGKSFSRTSYDASAAQHFIFTDSTPGAHNKTVSTMISSVNYPVGISLTPQLAPSSFFLLAIGVASTILFLFIYIFAKNENLSRHLFGGDQTNR